MERFVQREWMRAIGCGPGSFKRYFVRDCSATSHSSVSLRICIAEHILVCTSQCWSPWHLHPFVTTFGFVHKAWNPSSLTRFFFQQSTPSASAKWKRRKAHEIQRSERWNQIPSVVIGHWRFVAVSRWIEVQARYMLWGKGLGNVQMKRWAMNLEARRRRWRKSKREKNGLDGAWMRAWYWWVSLLDALRFVQLGARCATVAFFYWTCIVVIVFECLPQNWTVGFVVGMIALFEQTRNFPM